uniref:Uncharacterized protein n=1 Tax=Oryza brachyantha TaxID=4533 RepID=J3LHN1_ORYBR
MTAVLWDARYALQELWKFCGSLLMSNAIAGVNCRKGVSKLYNGKSGSFAKHEDSMIPSPPEKGLPKPENPSPRKRKGLLPFSFKWGKPQNKEVFPEDVVICPTNCRRMTWSPAAASSSGSNSGSDDEQRRSPKLHTRRPLRRPSNALGVFASPPAPRPPQVLSAHTRSHSMLDLQDVTESTAMFSPRDKRQKNSEGWILMHCRSNCWCPF